MYRAHCVYYDSSSEQRELRYAADIGWSVLSARWEFVWRVRKITKSDYKLRHE